MYVLLDKFNSISKKSVWIRPASTVILKPHLLKNLSNSFVVFSAVLGDLDWMTARPSLKRPYANVKEVRGVYFLPCFIFVKDCRLAGM